MRQEKREKRGGEKTKSKSQDCCVTFKPKNCHEELYVSNEVKENALASEGKSSIMLTRYNNLRKSICMLRPLSMKQAAKIT